jgi:hypothetical protein
VAVAARPFLPAPVRYLRTSGVRHPEPLPPEAWTRTAKVIGMLRETREHSALYCADWMAGHERVHWRHIRRIIAALDDRFATRQP